MDLKEIVKILMLSELYFNLPLEERKEVVWRVWAQYGQRSQPPASPWPPPPPVPENDRE